MRTVIEAISFELAAHGQVAEPSPGGCVIQVKATRPGIAARSCMATIQPTEVSWREAWQGSLEQSTAFNRRPNRQTV